MAKANLANSLVLARLMRKQYKYSFRNAYEAMRVMPERTLYVEGFAVDHAGVMSHGWVELDGEILEPTEAWRIKDNVEYFAGLKYERKYAVRLLQTYLTVPFAWRDDNLGMGDPRYECAYKDALAFKELMQQQIR